LGWSAGFSSDIIFDIINICILMRKIFIICSVRDANPEYRAKLEAYADMLEDNGAEVHLPHRDTDQEASGLDICRQNAMAINLSNEVHVFYSPKSQGTHFDMGVVFALDQIVGQDIKVVPVDNPIEGTGKSYARMLDEWMMSQDAGVEPLGYEDNYM
jgi:hypothetical protein